MTETYYGDLFKVNGKGVVVFGHGKTKVMRNVINNQDTDENALIIDDCICFDIKNGELVAMPDFFGFIQRPDFACKIDAMLYHEREGENGKYGKLDVDSFVEKAKFNINFGIDKDRRLEMKELLGGRDIDLINIPWCKTEEERKQIIIYALK